MPTTTDNIQGTTSDNGRNVRPELYAESHFFLETGVDLSQSDDQKFGVQSENQFNTTSRISFPGVAKVYAICQGQVFLQPNSNNTDRVNLILKPFRQPVNGLAIRYVVYRGILKSDLMDGNEVINPEGDDATGFVNHVRKEFKDFYAMLGKEAPVFKAQFLGYPAEDAPQLQKSLIDEYFFKVSKVDENSGDTESQPFDLPIIPAGTFLGTAEKDMGIDIVLNEGDFTIENDPNPFRLNLAFARSPNYILDTDNGSSVLEKKLIKETCTQFLDIAAFYGLHAQGRGKIYTNGQTSNPKQGADDIYGLIRNFGTANTVYLYIQSNRQRSYDFYGNYGYSVDNTTNLKIKKGEGAFEKEIFGESWPVIMIDGEASLQIQLTTDNSSGAGLYVKQGVLDATVTQHEDHFIRDKNLLQDSDAEEPLYTRPVAFGFVRSGNSTVSSFIQLIYEGKQISVTQESEDPNVPSSQFYMKDIDDVFGLIDAKPQMVLQTTSDLHYIIDQNLLLVNFENKAGGQDIATVTTKRVDDVIMKNAEENLPRFTYETLLNSIRQSMGSFFQSRSAYLDNSNSGMISYSKDMNNFYTPEKPYYLQTEVFTGFDGNTITGLSLQVQDGTLPSKKLMGITKDENDRITTLINDNQLNNPKFFFKNELDDEGSYYTSSEGIEYRRYSLCVIGEDQDGKLKFYEPESKVFVTTIDQCVFASEEYSKWVPKIDPAEKTINLIESKIYE